MKLSLSGGGHLSAVEHVLPWRGRQPRRRRRGRRRGDRLSGDGARGPGGRVGARLGRWRGDTVPARRRHRGRDGVGGRSRSGGDAQGVQHL